MPDFILFAFTLSVQLNFLCGSLQLLFLVTLQFLLSSDSFFQSLFSERPIAIGCDLSTASLEG